MTAKEESSVTYIGGTERSPLIMSYTEAKTLCQVSSPLLTFNASMTDVEAGQDCYKLGRGI